MHLMDVGLHVCANTKVTEHAGRRRRKPWALRRLPAECSAGVAATIVGVAHFDFGSKGMVSGIMLRRCVCGRLLFLMSPESADGDGNLHHQGRKPPCTFLCRIPKMSNSLNPTSWGPRRLGLRNRNREACKWRHDRPRSCPTFSRHRGPSLNPTPTRSARSGLEGEKASQFQALRRLAITFSSPSSTKERFCVSSLFACSASSPHPGRPLNFFSIVERLLIELFSLSHRRNH